MRVGVIGIEPEEATGILLNLRVRWPDLEAICMEHFQRTRSEVFDVLLVGSDTLPSSERVRKIRAACDSVLIVLSAQASDEELVAALEAGADDYLPLTASGPQIVARISAGLRRARPSETGAEWIRCGGLRMNAETFEAFAQDKPIHLTPTEFRLLYELMKSRGRLLTHDALERLVWGSEGSSYGDCVRKHIQRLRVKLESDEGSPIRIVTVPRVGYRVVANA